MPCRHINLFFTLLTGLQKAFTITKTEPGGEGNFYGGPCTKKDVCSGILGTKPQLSLF